METTTAAGTSTLGSEAVQLLSELLRFNTVNPPGNERPAQEHVARILEDAGFEVELLEREPDRTNVIARLPGEADGPILALISHMDTVPADPDEWSFSPWSGDVVDGFVQGRGGQDMKDQVATEVAAGAHLARSGWRPARGELKVIVAADEELGAHMGAKWLCEEHPEKVRADFVVNEGVRRPLRDRRPPLLRRLARREGRLPLQAPGARAARATAPSRALATTRCFASLPRSRAWSSSRRCSRRPRGSSSSRPRSSARWTPRTRATS